MNHLSRICDVNTCCVLRCCLHVNRTDALTDHVQEVLNAGCESQKLVCREDESVMCEEDDGPNNTILEALKSTCKETKSIAVNWWVSGLPILYGHGKMSCSEPSKLYFCDKSLLSQLRGILALLHVEDTGVVSPYLYVFEECTALAWQIEDDKGRIDVPHTSCKIWFCIPQKFVPVLNAFVENLLDRNVHTMTFVNLLGHTALPGIMQHTMAERLPVTIILQDPTECDILSSVNLSPLQTFQHVREVRVAGGNTDFLTALWRSHERDEKHHRGRTSSPASHPNHMHNSLKEELTTEITLDEKIVLKDDTSEREINVEQHRSPDQEHTRLESPSDDVSGEIPSKNSEDVPTVCTCFGPVLLQCPACSQIIKGGTNRIERLHCHIKDQHESSAEIIIKRVREIYPIIPCPLKVSDNDLSLPRETSLSTHLNTSKVLENASKTLSAERFQEYSIRRVKKTKKTKPQKCKSKIAI